MTLTPVAGSYAICQLAPDAPFPEWATRGPLWSITRSATELSIVCDAASVPPGVRVQAAWRALRVQGPLALDLTGILASLASPLAAAGVPLFAVSTFDTDYLLVPTADAGRAVAALRRAGHDVDEAQYSPA
jgi:hypothetical protein